MADEAIRELVERRDTPHADLVAPLVKLAQYGIPSDIQELLLAGDPMRNIRPGALAAALSSLQSKVEELERERDSARELMSASVEDYNDALAEKRAAEAKVERLAEALTPSAETKAAYSGEIEVTLTHNEFGYDTSRKVMLPWIVIKDVMEMIRARALSEVKP